MDKVERIILLAQKLFNDRLPIINLWQTLAENFYPERADFMTQRAMGEEFGVELMSSYPVQMRRDLGNAITSILRPTNKEWMHMRVKYNWDKVGVEARGWLEWAEMLMKRAMTHHSTMFVRSTKNADHDFATFGQAVIQVSLNRNRNGLLFKSWHLRDVAWLEDDSGRICLIARRSTPTAYDLNQWFRGKVHKDVTDALEKDPYKTFPLWHIVMDAEHWDGPAKPRHPFYSVYLDPEHKILLEEKNVRTRGYIIPRWSTVSGTQYAVSPATCVALPDARLMQSMVGVLLEAGEKAVNPPMVANKEVFDGNFSIYAGGTTWADFADGRIGDHFQVLPQDKSGIPLGSEMVRDLKAGLMEAFYLNKLSLPPPGPEMTAYETGQRVQEYIRQAMPLFEPMEQEYNAPLCEEVFDQMMYSGAFGSPYTFPEELRDQEVVFQFESPLHDATEKARGQKLLEAKSYITELLDADPSIPYIMDFKAALRDVLMSIQTPAKWVRSEADVIAKEREMEQTASDARQLELAQQRANVAQTVRSTEQAGNAAPQ